MPAAKPISRPKATRDEVAALIAPLMTKPGSKGVVVCVMVRAYYRDTMGVKGRNDVGMYDDAAFWLAPDHFSAWNANTDPSRYGWNPNAKGYMARLRPGVWRFIARKHRGRYNAFGQGGNAVVIDRVMADGQHSHQVRGHFGINLHRGGLNGTSSEGCLTIPTEQWTEFRDTGYGLLKRHGIKDSFPLFLVERPEVKK